MSVLVLILEHAEQTTTTVIFKGSNGKLELWRLSFKAMHALVDEGSCGLATKGPVLVGTKRRGLFGGLDKPGCELRFGPIVCDSLAKWQDGLRLRRARREHQREQLGLSCSAESCQCNVHCQTSQLKLKSESPDLGSHPMRIQV